MRVRHTSRVDGTKGVNSAPWLAHAGSTVHLAVVEHGPIMAYAEGDATFL